jgi:hypothetical protein
LQTIFLSNVAKTYYTKEKIQSHISLQQICIPTTWTKENLTNPEAFVGVILNADMNKKNRTQDITFQKISWRGTNFSKDVFTKVQFSQIS